jgi:hypothetical protein
MAPRAVGRVLLATRYLLTVACSEPTNSIGVACPGEVVERSATSGDEFPDADTREEAIRSALRDIEMPASRDAIVQTVVGSGPGPEPPKADAVVQTKSGVEVSMTLRPLDPGWTVDSVRWCADQAARPRPGLHCAGHRFTRPSGRFGGRTARRAYPVRA